MDTALEISQRTDEQLAAEAAREGSDGPAFTALLKRYQDHVWRVCYRLMSNAEDASDAAQEVFVRLFFNREKFRHESKYSTWVHGIAIRTCLTMRRGRGRRQKHEETARDRQSRKLHSQSGEGASETTLDLEQILGTLDEEDRAMLILKYAEGYAYDELAAMFELSASACKMRVSRAREKLKQRFPEHNFGSDTE